MMLTIDSAVSSTPENAMPCRVNQEKKRIPDPARSSSCHIELLSLDNRLILRRLPRQILATHSTSCINISITSPKKREKSRHTIPLISAPLTELLPQLRLHLTVIARGSISRIRILRFRAEKFALR